MNPERLPNGNRGESPKATPQGASRTTSRDGMTPAARAAIRQAGAEAVADWPPLTDGEIARLAVLITPPVPTARSEAS